MFLNQGTSPWIDNLPFRWESFFAIGQIINVKKNEVIFTQEQTAQHIYIIVEGRIRLLLISFSGEEKHLSIIGKNGLLGECSIFNSNKYSCSSVASSNATLVKIPAQQFLDKMKEEPDYYPQVMKMSNIKFQVSIFHNLQLSFYDARQRVINALLQLINTYGFKKDNQIIINIPFTHQEMANLVGTSRVTVSNIMNHLQKEEVLIKINGKYTINNYEKLISLTEI